MTCWAQAVRGRLGRLAGNISDFSIPNPSTLSAVHPPRLCRSGGLAERDIRTHLPLGEAQTVGHAAWRSPTEPLASEANHIKA